MSAASERSVSRGREQAAYTSSGRGGAGNIRPSSGSRDADSRTAGPGPDDYSQSRGREIPAPRSEKQRVFGSGRGGAGNIHSPTRGAGVESRNALREEAKYVKEHVNADIPVSHGRGGAGNISNSRSRSRTRDATSTSPGNPAGLSLVSTSRSEASATPLGKLPEEGTAHAHHSSGFSKITNLFHRGSRDAPKFSPEQPGEQ